MSKVEYVLLMLWVILAIGFGVIFKHIDETAKLSEKASPVDCTKSGLIRVHEYVICGTSADCGGVR